MTRTSIGIAVLVLLAGCSDSTGPGGPGFPALPSQMVADFCIRGDRAPGNAIAGSLAASDCAFGDGSFFETWRVRVIASGSHQFSAQSTFDNLLALYRVDSIIAGQPSLTFMGSNDNGGSGTNALLTIAALTPNTDYLLLVNGLDSTSVGSYTVAFTKP
jgi:hypothetical protein